MIVYYDKNDYRVLPRPSLRVLPAGKPPSRVELASFHTLSPSSRGCHRRGRRGGGRSPSWADRPLRSHARCLNGQRQRNARLLRRLAGTHEAVAGRPAGRPLLGRRTGLLRAARRTLRRHRSRAGALARLHFDHAALPFSVASPKTESAPDSPALGLLGALCWPWSPTTTTAAWLG